MQIGSFAPASALAAGLLAPPTSPQQASPTPDTPLSGQAWADVDVDGLPDLLARGERGGIALLRNLGGGGFADVTASYGLEQLSGVRRASWKDVDGDGLTDLLVLDALGRPSLWRHMGARFLDVTAEAGLAELCGALAEQWLDYDRDGVDDLLLAGAAGQALLRGLGDLRFALQPLPAAPPTLDPGAAEPGTASGPGSSASGGASGPAGASSGNGQRAGAAAGAPSAASAGELAERAEGPRRRPAPGRESGGTANASGPTVGATSKAANRAGLGGSEASACAPVLLDQAGGPCLEASSAPLLGALYPMTLDLNVSATGNLGLGTSAPLAALHLRDQDLSLQPSALLNESAIIEDGDAVLGLYSLTAGTWASALVLGQVAAGGALIDKWSFARQTSGPGGGNGGLYLTYGPGADYSGNGSVMVFEKDGDVGIGSVPANNQLYVAQPDATGVAARVETWNAANPSTAMIVYHNGSGTALSASTNSGDVAISATGKTGLSATGSSYGVETKASTTGIALWANNPAGNNSSAALVQSTSASPTLYVTNFTASNPQAASFGGDVHIGYPGFAGLTVDRVVLGADSTNAGFLELWNDQNEATIVLDASKAGEGRITTEVLEITGGADLVESFDTREETIEPGTVLVIDAERAGELAVSCTAYDRRVAGVVSGAGGIRPGLSMGQAGVASGDTPVALGGRVFVKASAENGAIRPGDRLTSAGTPGHAMRVADESRAAGAVIGKALGALEQGTGLVLVLVNLQ